MMRREKLLAIISSPDLHLGGGDGYALVVTDGRIVGSGRPGPAGVSVPRLWSATGSSEADRAEAEKDAADLIGRRQFELSKESIYKIVYDAPGLFFAGRVVFEAVGGRVQLGISSPSVWDPNGVLTVRALVGSLLAFAPEKLYNERTGGLVSDGDASRRNSGLIRRIWPAAV